MLTLIIWSICLCGSVGPRAQPKHLGLLMSLPGKPPWHASAISRLCNVRALTDDRSDCILHLGTNRAWLLQPAWINSILLASADEEKSVWHTSSLLVYLWTKTCVNAKRSRVAESLAPPSAPSGQQMLFSFQVIEEPQNSFFHHLPLIL